MESGGAVPGAGAEGASGGAGGLLCHACGYRYPNAHPSAKQRRAHRKHCGKPASGEPEGRVLFPGEGGDEPGVGGGGGDGIKAITAERGGGSPGSAREAGSAAVDVDKTERSSHDDAGAQVIVDKCGEEQRDVASKITVPETNRTDDSGTLNEVATEYSGKASLPEEEVPSVPASAVSSVQLQDVSVPVLQPEPGCGEGVSPDLSSVSEMQNSNAVSLASGATGGEISEQTNDVITEPNGTTAAGVDGAANTIGKDTLSKEKSAKGGGLDSSCQENLQAKVREGHGNTAVEEDSSDKNLSAVQMEDIPNDKPESNQQSSPMLTSPIEPIPNIEEPVKSGTQVPVGADDFHSEATDTVKTQEQPDSTSVEDHLAVPEQTDVLEGEHYANKDGGTETISSAVGPAVIAEVISVGDADNMTKNVYSSDATIGDIIQENVTSNTFVPSQADLVDLTESTAACEINMVNSPNNVEEKGQNVADLTIHKITEVHITELVEEEQQDKEIVAADSHLANAVCNTDNYGENEKETISEASSCNIPSTSSIEEEKQIEEEEKQIEEVIANLVPEKTNVTSNREDVEENKQIEIDVKTNREKSVVRTTEAIEEKDMTSKINSENIIDNVEVKKPNEEISADDISAGTSMICSTVNEEKMHNEDMTEDPSSDEKTVVHSTDNIEEKNNEETMVDPTSHSIGMGTAVNSIEERKNDKTSADLTSHAIHAAHATEEKKDGEPILEPISSKISTVGGVGDVEEKQQNEETATDQISGGNSTQQSTYAAENGMQNKDDATDLVSEKLEVAEKMDAVDLTEQNNKTTAKEISTVHSTDDLKGAGQNEEITDKEVIVDSDRSHVSLKVLLADKNVETKEKKPSTKDTVLSFRRRSSKDNESPVKPSSPNASSGQQDWNSPARLPAEKKSKGKKQQWMPFICCSAIH